MITKIPTSICINGDIIAEDVYDLNGTVLFNRGMVIDNELKKRLVDIGISEISICNPIHSTKDYEKLHKAMLQDIRKCLGEVIFRKEYMYTKVTQYLARMYESIDDNPIIINALSRIKVIDEYTFTHSINTAFYSMFIAIWMGLEDYQIINATQAGLLHDIGKIYIPYEILNKPSSLTEDEYDIIKKHTLYGYFLLNEFGDINAEVKRAVLFHHERTDLKGYPLSASPDYVGTISKIVAVSDVYDAMTTDRVYKKGASPAEAVNFLRNDGLNMLDKQVVKVFTENIPVYDFKIKGLIQ
jgi:HD-GYP domain-containing protein (c-di-GMP phosphodiesterase class II)